MSTGIGIPSSQSSRPSTHGMTSQHCFQKGAIGQRLQRGTDRRGFFTPLVQPLSNCTLPSPTRYASHRFRWQTERPGEGSTRNPIGALSRRIGNRCRPANDLYNDRISRGQPMATHQSKAQKETVSRVMHEFKHGELESSSGRKVQEPEAGDSDRAARGRRFKIREQEKKSGKSEADQGARTTRRNREGSERASR